MKALAVICLLLVIHVQSHGQSNERIQRTWKGPDISAIWGLLKEENNGASSKPQSRSNPIPTNYFSRGNKRLAKVPALAAMSNVEKQQMHDWLVCMGGFSLTNYLDAKQNRDAQALATIKDFADYSMRIVLGVEGVK